MSSSESLTASPELGLVPEQLPQALAQAQAMREQTRRALEWARAMQEQTRQALERAREEERAWLRYRQARG